MADRVLSLYEKAQRLRDKAKYADRKSKTCLLALAFRAEQEAWRMEKRGY